MKRINILNGAAGQGDAAHINPRDGENYYTAGVGDATAYVKRMLASAPDIHFFVYGGDGTVCEVVNGILEAGAGETALLSVVPTGTGNDFVRSFSGATAEPIAIDAIRCNGKYAVNMLNIGFDCDVVARAAELKTKPLVSGSGAYYLGVLSVLTRKMGQKMTVSYTSPGGQRHTQTDDFLLCAVANAAYCGGGFCAAPTAKLCDGILNVLLVKTVSRRRFLSLVGDYKAGRHIENEKVIPKFADIMQYIPCTALTLDGIHAVCADGEVTRETRAQIEVVPHAIRYAPVRKA